MQSFFSPYEFNPMGLNPFFEFLIEFFDFDALNKSDVGLHVSTTEVETGKIKVWHNGEISAEVLMASACLPFLYQAVEINNRFYWDGGFLANPAIFPLIDNRLDAEGDACDAITDIVVIQLTRQKCNTLPTTRSEIHNRLQEITLNGCLTREIRAIHLITKLIDDGVIAKGKMRRCNLHVIRNEQSFSTLNMSSAINMDRKFINFLYKEGYKTASAWLEKHFSDIGVAKAVDCTDDNIFSDFV
jgi:NTE family protein